MMGDTAPLRRERMFNIPAVVLALCAILLAIQAMESLSTSETNFRLLVRFAFVPGRFTFAFDPDGVSAALNQIAAVDEFRALQLKQFVEDGSVQWWTAVTYAFLHGGWVHVGLNCLWLVAFGGAVAKRLSAARFLGFLLVCTLAGALAHYLAHPADLEPVVGASAAVSGAMGAAVRFMFQLVSRDLLSDGGGGSPAVLPLRQVVTDRRCLTFIAIWFFSNLVFGVSGAMPGTGGAPVAWEAHVGGFLAGLLLYGLFDRPATREALPSTDATSPPDDGLPREL